MDNSTPSSESPLNDPEELEVPGEQVVAPSIHRPVTAIPVRELSRNLQQTSAALDAAYNRIRQVRRNLLELSETLPVTLSQLRIQAWENEVVPARDAGLISPHQNPDIYRSEGHRTLISRARTSLNWSPFSNSEDYLQGSLTTSEEYLQHRTNSTPNLGSPARMFTRMRANAVRSNEDDGSTLLGRRVAARLALAPTLADELSEGVINSIAQMSRSYEGELDRILQVLNERTRASAVSRSNTRRTSTIIQASQDHSQSPLPLSHVTTQPSNPHSNPSQTPQDNLGSGSTLDNRQYSGPSERLSPSNSSAQAPPSNLSIRPLFFDQSGRPAESPRSAVVESLDGRNYVVVRNYDRNGSETVHTISVDWDDDESQWLMPSSAFSRRYRNRIDHRSLREQEEPSSAPDTAVDSNAPRRRGWARLDLDGNEIPPEEEEEIERIRTEERIRSPQRLPQLASAMAAGSNPTTQNQNQKAKAKINKQPRQKVILKHDPSLSYPSDFVYPLPMPLSEMDKYGLDDEKSISTSTTKQRNCIRLRRDAVAAGR